MYKTPCKRQQCIYKNIISALIDKANRNIAFICEYFFAQTLLKELGLTASNTSKTFTMDTSVI